MTDEEWVIEWSNGRIATKDEAKDLIEGYWYALGKLKRPPKGIFPDAFTIHILSTRPNVSGFVPVDELIELAKTWDFDGAPLEYGECIRDLKDLIENNSLNIGPRTQPTKKGTE